MIFASKLHCALLSSILLSGVMPAGAAPARPAQNYSPWYAGIGYQRASFPGANMDALGLLGGYNFSRFVGIEIGTEVGRVSGVRLTDGYVEAIGRLPLARGLTLFGTVGGAYAQADAAVRVGSVTITASQHGSGVRAGGGVEWWFANRWGLRGAFHHQDALAKTDGVSVDLMVRF
jgi:opacity protein-like surface antigen